MNWLVDVQLPPRHCVWLQARGENVIHVENLENGLSLSDEVLWQKAKAENLVVISKDRDFFERALLRGSPPQVLHITVGNCTNEMLLHTKPK